MDDHEPEGPIPGQMDVFECIEIAAVGADGKPPTRTEPSRKRTVAEIVRDRLTKGTA